MDSPSKTYSEAMKGQASNTWWRRYQEEDKKKRTKQTAATGTFAVTDKRDRPSHTPPSSSSHVPVPDLLFSNYSLVPASQLFPLFPLPSCIGAPSLYQPPSQHQPPSQQPLSQHQPPSLYQPSSSGVARTPYHATPHEQWHSGLSPYHYEICLLPTKVQKCYGCGSDFVDKYRKPPFNLVVQHVDRRVIRRNEVTGQLVFSHTYYHPSCAHLRHKNPVFTGLVFISNEPVCCP